MSCWASGLNWCDAFEFLCYQWMNWDNGGGGVMLVFLFVRLLSVGCVRSVQSKFFFSYVGSFSPGMIQMISYFINDWMYIVDDDVGCGGNGSIVIWKKLVCRVRSFKCMFLNWYFYDVLVCFDNIWILELVYWWNKYR